MLARPHVFNTSNASYRGICDRHKSQTVLISGESGAGKTETTKQLDSRRWTCSGSI